MANSPTEGASSAECTVHGPFVPHQIFRGRWTSCPACAEEAEQRREAQAETERRCARIELRLLLSGLQGRFLAASFDGFEAPIPEQRRVLDECRAYIDSFAGHKGGLTLIGKPGTGKTHLGSAMVNKLIREHDTAAMIFSGREIVRMLRSTWGGRPQPVLGHYESLNFGNVDVRRPDTEEGMLHMLGTVPLLVIDEIGVQFGSDAETVQLFDVIDLRYKHELPTVVLSNLTGAELKKALGDRAYDRIREGSRLLACRWSSRRGGADAPA